MKIYTIEELFKIAKEFSPFYRELYKSVNSFKDISDLPIFDSVCFWKENSIKNNQVLTSVQQDGIVFKSGGTTGNPKFSFFTLEEWEIFTLTFGQGMAMGGLGQGERIANLFYAGDLYASFLFILKSIEKSGTRAIQYPLSGGADFNHIVDTINSFEIETWAGVPTTIMKLTEYAQKNQLLAPKKILFGGESLYQDQIEFIKDVFPDAHVQSIGYASVDGGLLGFADSSCLLQEHRVFSDHTIIEILDEDTLEPINDVNRSGKMFLTNLTRSLMPIIRYPVGDKAMWIEDQSQERYRKFKILGRSEEGARVGPATIFYEDISKLLYKFHNQIHIKGFQVRLAHFDNRDQLIIRIAAQSNQDTHETQLKLKKLIVNCIYEERGLIKNLVSDNLIHPIETEFVDMAALETNERTGKLKRIIDIRN
ncbi:MAG: phenylacetate--CoA ligase family protein [Bdellovibrionaceae bacterium]|nr:phenylacetate--CoA ligase family protein [Pseudobdellovibrionaceae bacterium]